MRRQLRHDNTAGEVLSNAIDSPELMDEAAALILAQLERNLAGLDFLIWFYVRIRQELAHRLKTWRQDAQQRVSLRPSYCEE